MLFRGKEEGHSSLTGYNERTIENLQPINANKYHTNIKKPCEGIR